jgi:sec-independent protein translocase protein TatA
MPELGVPELLIIAVIVLLLFGPGKAADIGSSLGKGIREFRKATTEDDAPAPAAAASQLAATATSGAIASSAAAADVAAPDGAAASGRFCIECGTLVHEGQKFCTNCGASVAARAG